MQRLPLQETGLPMRSVALSGGGDENMGGSAAGSFAVLTQAFSQRVAELQQLTCLRIEGKELLDMLQNMC